MNNLKGGVLIIGSLLWQDHLNITGDNIRLNWRNNNLDMDNIIPVKVPIRYGRVSLSNIPTTIYSNSMKDKLGSGYVIPFKNKINNVHQLQKEIAALSVVEGLKGNLVRKWGILSYLLNNNIAKTNSKIIIDFFDKHKHMDFDPNDYKFGNETSCVTKSLELNINIDWKQHDKLKELDFLLATATKPNIQPNNIEKIAGLIKTDKKRYYYLNNVANGIITNEDNNISELL